MTSLGQWSLKQKPVILAHMEFESELNKIMYL